MEVRQLGRYVLEGVLGQGRDGRRLPRARPGDRTPGRPQDPHRPAGDRGGRGVPPALPARGAGGRHPQPPGDRHGPRRRRRRGQRPLLHRHGVHRGQEPEGRSARRAHVRLLRGGADRRRPGRRPRLRPLQGRRAPRHQAGQHHPHAAGAGEDHRLRRRPDGVVEPHRDRPVHRHPELHVAGAGDRVRHRRAQRPLLARRRPLRADDRQPAVRRRLADRGRLQDRPRAAADPVPGPCRPAAGVQPDRPQAAREAGRQALPEAGPTWRGRSMPCAGCSPG